MDWDAKYRSGDIGPAEPHRLVVEAAAMLPAGRALDLACGAGRHARWLSERGWRVIGVDRALPARPDVVADLETHAPPFRNILFDLIIIINFLYRPLFARALQLLREGGAIAAAVRTSGHYSLPAGQLRRAFDGCTIAVERPGEVIAIKGVRTGFSRPAG